MEKFYKETPLEKIPWNKTQADFFQKLLNSNELGNGTALDSGCGVGTKSIALAKKGFSVTGIDIAPTAIRHAKEKANNENVKVRFITADATNLAFLGNKKFDLILDWANLHMIIENKREKYIKGIIKHCKKGGLFLLRCFSKHGASKMEIGFLTVMGPIYLFSRNDVEKLFGKHFKVIKINRSKAWKHPWRLLDEYLMKRL
ncbi:class I SAM-dependent methyltransferase [Patescibacteria group bacterium]